VLGRADLATDPRFTSNSQRVAARADLIPMLAEILKDHRVDELVPKLEAAGIPYAPIVRPEQLLDDPHLKASGGLAPITTEDGGTTDVVLLPLAMGGRRPGVRRALAKIGEHTQEILGRLKARAPESGKH
jgi:formyl-CoA transferase